MSSSYRMELDRWLSQVDVKANRLLDIGGAQLPVKGRTKSWDVKEYCIADLPEPHVNSPKPDLELDLNYPLEYNVAQYDVIFCLEVFDYIFNPVQAFDNIFDLLKMDGKAYVSFGLVYPTHNPIEDDMLRYTEFAIRRLCRESGLILVDLFKRRPETNAIENLWRAERMRAAKHYDHNVTGFIAELTK